MKKFIMFLLTLVLLLTMIMCFVFLVKFLCFEYFTYGQMFLQLLRSALVLFGKTFVISITVLLVFSNYIAKIVKGIRIKW